MPEKGCAGGEAGPGGTFWEEASEALDWGDAKEGGGCSGGVATGAGPDGGGGEAASRGEDHGVEGSGGGDCGAGSVGLFSRASFSAGEWRNPPIRVMSSF